MILACIQCIFLYPIGQNDASSLCRESVLRSHRISHAHELNQNYPHPVQVSYRPAAKNIVCAVSNEEPIEELTEKTKTNLVIYSAM